MNTDSAFLSFHGISKTFPGVKALQDISFDCRGGEVHALHVFPHSFAPPASYGGRREIGY